MRGITLQQSELDTMILEISKHQREMSLQHKTPTNSESNNSNNNSNSNNNNGNQGPKQVLISFQEFKYLTRPESKVQMLTKLRSTPSLERKGFINIAKRLEDVKQKQKIVAMETNIHSNQSLGDDENEIKGKGHFPPLY